MHALVFGKARVPARTLLARAGGVFMWPGIALTERRGVAGVPIAADVARFWISRLHGPEAIDSAVLRCLAIAAQKLSEGDEAAAQTALDASGLTRLSSDGAVLMRAVAGSLGIGPLDLPGIVAQQPQARNTRSSGAGLVKSWLECYQFGVIARMRDKHGGPHRKLSIAEKQKISEAINASWGGRSEACPICGNTQWLIADHLVATTTLGAGGAFQLGGQVYPLVMLISPCGYTRHFNAIMLGVHPSAKPPEEATQPAEVEKQ